MNTDKMPHREILICLERILYDWLGSEADKYLLTRIATVPPCIPLKKRNFLLKNI